MNYVKVIVCTLVVFSTYFYGYHQGKNSEELKNARLEISTLNATIAKHKDEQERLSGSLADLRVSESRARDESEWMRSQLSELERRAKSNTAGDCLRFQRLAVEKEELLNEAKRGLEFCYKNHR